MPTTSRMRVPFPRQYSEEWFDRWLSFMSAIDGHHFAAFEDRNLFLTAGGTWSWDLASSTLTWDADLVIFTPSTGQPQTLSAGSFVLQEGEMLVVDLSRGASAPAPLSAYVEDVLPPDDAVLAICARQGGNIYFRNGLVLGDGDAFDIFLGWPVATKPLDHVDLFTAASSQTVFTLSETPHPRCEPLVFRQGVAMVPGAGNDYEISGDTVTFGYAVPDGQVVQVRFWT